MKTRGFHTGSTACGRRLRYENDYKPRVTGKQVLLDAATLAKDTGIFLIDLGKRVYNAVKTALADDGKTDKPEAVKATE